MAGALFTDLYQLTMAGGYWQSGVADHEAVFHLYFRKSPFGGGYAVAGGIGPALDYLRDFAFDDDDVAYLESLEGADGTPLFAREFLAYLRTLALSCSVDVVPEGTVVFPHEPILRVQGPIVQAQLLETALLNLVNFGTLITTKAARVCHAADGEPVLEFGLRRAQGPDGGLSASRAAYIGGCSATSNVLAGRRFGIPVRGTHAHAWVLAFGDEQEAFDAWAEAMPNNVVLLVDTYDTLAGVRRAVETGRRLRERGGELLGIRLDSGDLAHLSREARRILDEAGFTEARILASNDLDEHTIASIRQQHGRVDTWAVGTRLVTGGSQAALGGVYKLSAIRAPGGPWEHRVKVSEQSAKVNTPGRLQVRRYRSGGECVGDAIWDTLAGPPEGEVTIVDLADPTRRKRLPAGTEWEDLLVPAVEGGRVTYRQPPLAEVRARVQAQLAGFHEGVKRFENPHAYPAGLERGLHERRTALLLAARGEG